MKFNEKNEEWEDFIPSINYLVLRRCTPEWRISPHLVDGYDITYVTRGSAEYTVNGRVYTLGPGDLLCLGPGTAKEARTWPDRLMRCFSVNFSPRKRGPEPPAFPEIRHIGIRRDLAELFNELIFAWEEKQEGCLMKTRGLLLLILHRLWEFTSERDTAGEDWRIKRVCRHIALHYAENIPLSKLASLVNLNRVYFGALFKRKTGFTVHQYIARTRVRHAENLLQTGEYKVWEAAEHCGYRDVFHFYKQFRSVMGFPPSRCIPKR